MDWRWTWGKKIKGEFEVSSLSSWRKMVSQNRVSGSSYVELDYPESETKQQQQKCFYLIMRPVQSLSLWRRNCHCVCFLCLQIKILETQNRAVVSLSDQDCCMTKKICTLLRFFCREGLEFAASYVREILNYLYYIFLDQRHSGWAGSFVIFFFFFFHNLCQWHNTDSCLE